MTKLTAPLAPAGTVAAAAPNGYVLDGRLNDSFRAASLLLDKGVAVRRASHASDDGSVKAGDFLVAAGDRRRRRSRRQTGVDFAAAKSAIASGAYALHKPQVGMYQRYNGGNMDEGWTRLMFEQFNLPSTVLMDAEIEGRQPQREVRHDHSSGRFDICDDR